MEKLLLLSLTVLLLGAGCTSSSDDNFDKKQSCATQVTTFNAFLENDEISVTARFDELPGYITHDLDRVCYSEQYDTCVARVFTNYNDKIGDRAHAANLYDMFTFQLLDTEYSISPDEKEIWRIDGVILEKMHCIE